MVFIPKLNYCRFHIVRFCLSSKDPHLSETPCICVLCWKQCNFIFPFTMYKKKIKKSYNIFLGWNRIQHFPTFYCCLKSFYQSFSKIVKLEAFIQHSRESDPLSQDSKIHWHRAVFRDFQISVHINHRYLRDELRSKYCVKVQRGSQNLRKVILCSEIGVLRREVKVLPSFLLSKLLMILDRDF